MGYWSSHPMGGDTPLDHKDMLIDGMFKNKEELTALFKNKEFKLFFEKLRSYVEDEEMDFIVPYVLMGIGLASTHPGYIDEFSKILENTDGGSYMRAYEEDDKNTPAHYIQYFKKVVLEDPTYRIFKKIESVNPNYEIFISNNEELEFTEENVPEELTAKFQDEKEFNNIFDEGLLNTIAKHIESGEEGLVNTN